MIAGILRRGKRIVVRAWRISRAEPSGMVMWFDPELEVPSLSVKRLTDGDESVRLDRIGSMSGTEDDAQLVFSFEDKQLVELPPVSEGV